MVAWMAKTSGSAKIVGVSYFRILILSTKGPFALHTKIEVVQNHIESVSSNAHGYC